LASMPNIAAMLTEIYIEALLVDEELADQVWEAWDVGEIDDQWRYWLGGWSPAHKCLPAGKEYPRIRSFTT